jgi:hypothetical protein
VSNKIIFIYKVTNNFTHSTVIRDNAFLSRHISLLALLHYPNIAIGLINLRAAGSSN